MKEVIFTFSDYSPADGDAGIYGFIVFQVYYHEDSYGFFATLDAAKKRIASLKKHFNYPFNIAQIHVSF